MSICKNTNKNYVIICFYVNDILILHNNEHLIKFIKKMIMNFRKERDRFFFLCFQVFECHMFCNIDYIS